MIYFSARDRIMAEAKEMRKMKLTKRGKTVKRIATVGLWLFILFGAYYIATVPVAWWTSNGVPIR